MIASPANDPDQTQAALVRLSSVLESATPVKGRPCGPLLTREGQTGAALSKDRIHRMIQQSRPCSAETVRLHSVGDGAWWGTPVPSYVAGLRPTPVVQTRTSPETETRKAETRE